MKIMTSIAAAALMGLAASSVALAQAPSPRPNAIVEFPGKTKLTVTTSGWKDGGDIPFENTQYRSNTFPGLEWTKGPKGTQSYALIMQDTDGVMRGAPILHWTLYNIPASVTKLPVGMTPDGKPAGSSYGPNYRGNAQAYLGPRTPPGPKHHYHLQILALDTVLQADSAITYDAMADQIKGHVLATGEVVGLGQADPTAPPPPPRPARPAGQ
jgi:para-nitrobenzyl esterase